MSPRMRIKRRGHFLSLQVLLAGLAAVDEVHGHGAQMLVGRHEFSNLNSLSYFVQSVQEFLCTVHMCVYVCVCMHVCVQHILGHWILRKNLAGPCLRGPCHRQSRARWCRRLPRCCWRAARLRGSRVGGMARRLRSFVFLWRCGRCVACRVRECVCACVRAFYSYCGVNVIIVCAGRWTDGRPTHGVCVSVCVCVCVCVCVWVGRFASKHLRVREGKGTVKQ
jgi:hypothetical protein